MCGAQGRNEEVKCGALDHRLKLSDQWAKGREAWHSRGEGCGGMHAILRACLAGCSCPSPPPPSSCFGHSLLWTQWPRSFARCFKRDGKQRAAAPTCTRDTPSDIGPLGPVLQTGVHVDELPASVWRDSKSSCYSLLRHSACQR
eukprot:352077-Chlamydomonas_euryale.AAC.1